MLEKGKTYVIATRSRDWLAKAIRFFSEKGSKLYEFDHVILYKDGEIIHMTLPHTKREKLDWRAENHIYQVIEPYAKTSWELAIQSYERQDKYGVFQLVSKAFTMLLRINPIRARQDCIEAILRWVKPNMPIDYDKVSVAQGIQILVDKKAIFKVGVKIQN